MSVCHAVHSSSCLVFFFPPLFCFIFAGESVNFHSGSNQNWSQALNHLYCVFLTSRHQQFITLIRNLRRFRCSCCSFGQILISATDISVINSTNTLRTLFFFLCKLGSRLASCHQGRFNSNTRMHARTFQRVQRAERLI